MFKDYISKRITLEFLVVESFFQFKKKRRAFSHKFIGSWEKNQQNSDPIVLIVLSILIVMFINNAIKIFLSYR